MCPLQALKTYQLIVCGATRLCSTILCLCFCRLNSRTKAVVSDAEVAFKGFTIAPAVNWQKQEKGITLSRKVGRGTLKSSYAVDRQLAALEYNFKPYKVRELNHIPALFSQRREARSFGNLALRFLC